MSATIYRKYRPVTFAEIVGQDHVKQTLQNEIKRGQIAHAYLFAGPRGLGKTTTARIFAKSVNCSKRKDSTEPCNKCDICQAVNNGRWLDLVEIDAASNRGINEIRQLKEHIGLTPAGGKFRVFIIDEAHMLTAEAFNALLKTLEEPPAHVIFILATTEPQKLPSTIISRCQRFNFGKVANTELQKRLEKICQAEKIAVDKEVLQLVARYAGGYMRDAESLLGQVLSLSTKNKKITLKDTSFVLPEPLTGQVEELLNFVSAGDLPQALTLVNKLSETGVVLSEFCREVIDFLRRLLHAAVGYETAELAEWRDKFSQSELVQLIKLLMAAEHKLKEADIPELPLEMALVEYNLIVGVNNEDQAEATAVAGEKAKRPAVSDIESDKSKKSKKDASVSAVTIDAITKRWREVVVTSKEYNHSMPFILKIAEPLSWDGRELALGFEYEFHLNRLADKKNKKIAEQVLSDIFGTKFRIATRRFTESEITERQASRGKTNSGEDEQLVSQVLQIFGGEVVE